MAGKFGAPGRHASNPNSMFGHLRGAGKSGTQVPEKMGGTASSTGINTSPPLDPAAQIAQLVCRVNQKWDADQSPNKEGFLHDLRIMIGLDPDHSDHGIFSRELRLSDAQRAALIVAVSTLLNIDKEKLQSEIPHSQDALHREVAQHYGSDENSVERFRDALIQKMQELSEGRQ